MRPASARDEDDQRERQVQIEMRAGEQGIGIRSDGVEAMKQIEKAGIAHRW